MANAAAPQHDGQVVICGGGIIAASIAYYLTRRGVKPLVIERTAVGAAASGKAGGFLARGWGNGTPTEALHQVSFDLHAQLADELQLSTYRRIPTLQVRTRAGGPHTQLSPPPADWLDGPEVVSASVMDTATAQVTPLEITTKLMDAAVAAGAVVRHGVVTGIDITAQSDGDGARRVVAVRVDGDVVPCTRAIVAMGPWSVLAEDWFPDTGLRVPLQGIKSASVVIRNEQLKARIAAAPFALFCGEDSRYGTHLECYPRSNGELYVCGIGGSDYVSGDRLRPGGDTESQEMVSPDPKRVAAAQAALGGMISLTAGAPDVTQACMRPCAPDAMPLMGEIPAVGGAYIACGHNCWGILWAPVTGLAMSELILDGKSSCVDLSAFSPQRFMTSSSTRGRKQGAVAVGEQW
jgi:glycine/D-amino acid oxidase-like deaminating enzyme